MSWKHIVYEDGSNPYICTTEKEFNRIKRKYKDKLVQISETTYLVKEN